MALLEREPLLAALDGLLRDAAGGQGRLVFLGGEAGIGKTALVERVARQARQAARVVVGACDPLSTPRPLGPLVDIAGVLGGDMARLLQEVAPRDQVFRAFLAALTAGTKPTLAAFEDVHWADDATLDLLRFLGRRIGGSRALLLATYRDDEVGVAHPLRLVLGDLATAPAVRRLTLPPLSQEAVRTLAADSGLDPAALHRQTGGNPFFVTEVLAAGGAGIPPTVRDAILTRVARLSAAGRATLEAAAAIGARIDPRLLAAVAAADLAAMEECVALGMLRAEGPLLAFRHELVREAVLDALSPPRALQLHRRILDNLLAAPGGPDDLARLAHHAEAADDRAAVLAHAPAAARRAASLGAHREAAAQYARALRFAGEAAPDRRVALLEAYAEESMIVDRLDEAIAARQEALTLRRAAGDGLQEGVNLSELALLLVNAGKNQAAEEASRAAIAVLEALPPGRQLALAYRAQAALRMLNRDTAEAIAWCEKALGLLERFGSTADLAAAYNVMGTALLAAGDERGQMHFDRCMRLAREAGRETLVALALVNLGSSLGEYYQFARAERYLAEGIAFCTERDLDRYRLYMLAWFALCVLYQGRWDEAAAAALAVVNRPGGSAISRIMALVALGRLRARRDDPGSAAALDEALALAAQTGTLQRLAPVHAARAEAAWLAGDRERTAAEARAAYDLAVRHDHAWFSGELAYWRWRAGDLNTPPGGTTPFARQIAGDWAGAAAAWEQLGCPYEAARALADGDDEAALRRALAEFERLGARPAAQAAGRRLRDLGARGVPRGPRPATRANPVGLTPREAEVAELLVAGLSNAAIAGRLYLSAKTVDHHVSAVLAKLGARTRAEAAREVTRLGLFAQSGEATPPK